MRKLGWKCDAILNSLHRTQHAGSPWTGIFSSKSAHFSCLIPCSARLRGQKLQKYFPHWIVKAMNSSEGRFHSKQKSYSSKTAFLLKNGKKVPFSDRRARRVSGASGACLISQLFRPKWPFSSITFLFRLVLIQKCLHGVENWISQRF